MAGKIVWVLVATAATGCAIDSSGHLARDGGTRGGEMDGNMPGLDAGTRETGPPYRPDTGPSIDAGTPAIDAGPPEVDAGVPPPLCAPLGSRCSSDGTARIDCTDLGESIVPCSRGCTGTDCRPPGFCPFIPETAAIPSVTVWDTCPAGDDHDFVPVMAMTPPRGSCRAAYPANGDDVVMRFEIDRPRRLRLVLVDADPGYMIDPILYVRTGACDATGTQVACNDDVDPEMGRAAGIERVFDAGEYFVVLDAYNDGGGWRRCGFLELRVIER